MKVRKGSGAVNSDDASDPKQDPLERRRLQNRLSQRNHRRKIRDRIAKLQERVIANELRATAALNGWDQPYSPSPLITTRHLTQPGASSGMGTSYNSQLVADSSSPFMPSYGLSMIPTWPGTGTTAQPSTLLPGESTCLFTREGLAVDAAYSSSAVTGLMNNGTIQPLLGDGEEHANFNMSIAGGFHTPGPLTTHTNQPLYYVATENALPQILQVLSTMSPQSKIIVLVSPDSVSAALGDTVTTTTVENNGSGFILPQIGNAQIPTCQCQSPNTSPTLATSFVPRPWTNPASYQSACPLNKMNHTLGETLSATRL
ncbi:uncharacterized protein N7482_003236 [Penicillium canariense]|uniref:BZIP domain-containing protein n=1 Tax=Penicillium canariense TaxID=189055 RepID=A0A9W9I9Y8_9EURO|nr:uncharacterized protein N7482_003236 [Penicillium canariense]KAJ5167642.1 hypothetical protein N7482_003236 [Penicillium canariense]